MKTNRRPVGAFTLYEVVIVVALLAIVTILGIPEVMKARVRAKASSETENLRLIESAKAQFSRANPGMPIGSVASLYPYLPNRRLPVSPWGVSYQNVTNLAQTVSSPANGQDGKEPPLDPLDANGYNDLGVSGLVYLKPLDPSGFSRIGDPTGVGPVFGTGSGVSTGTGTPTGTGTGIVDPLTGTGTGTGTGSGTGSGSGSGLPTGSGSGTGRPPTFNGPPVVSLVGEPVRVFRGQRVVYTAAATDPDLDPLDYKFLPSGQTNYVDSADELFEEAYETLGKKTVEVEVQDPSGDTATAEASIDVVNRPPTVVLNVGPAARLPVGTTATFTAAGKDPDSDSLVYAFTVHGQSYAGSPATQTRLDLPKVGRYVATVVAKDPHGGVSEPAQASVVVYDPTIGFAPPEVSLRADPPVVFRNQRVLYTATGVDPVGTGLVYTFKNGSTQLSTGQSPTVTATYPTLGPKVVTVDVVDSNGQTAQDDAQVQVVNRPPTVAVVPSPAEVTRNGGISHVAYGTDLDGDALEYCFYDSGTGTWSAWGPHWLYNTYPNIGNFQITAYVRDAFGGSGSGVALFNVIRNLAFYWNQSSSPATSNSVNYSGVGDAAVFGALAKANAASLTGALASIGKSTASSSVVGAVAHIGHTVTISDVGWKTQSSWQQVVGHTPGKWVGNGKARHYVPAETYWRMVTDSAGGVDRTQTTVNTYSQTTSTTSASYSAGFVMLDQDTGEVLGTLPASQWDNLANGVITGAGSSRGAVGSKFAAQGSSTTSSTATWSASSVWSGRITTWTHQAFGGVWSPLTVSFGAVPDYLAGPEAWRKEDSRQPVFAAMRKFDLDGTGIKVWEWVGPEEGLLVFNPGKDPALKVTGKELFGNSSFGKSYPHGYEPLAELDKDKDGNLAADELDAVWIWRDLNSDAQVQEGEFEPATEYEVVSIPVDYETDSRGGLISPVGVQLREGKVLAMRDWWSMGGIPVEEFLSYLKETLATPVLYQWAPVDSEAMPDLKGGTFRFQAPEGDSPLPIMGISVAAGVEIPGDMLKGNPAIQGKKIVPALAFPIQAIEPGIFGWLIPDGKQAVTTRMKAEGNTLLGMTAVLAVEVTGEGEDAKLGQPEVVGSYQWKGQLVSGPTFPHLFDVYVAKLLWDKAEKP